MSDQKPNIPFDSLTSKGVVFLGSSNIDVFLYVNDFPKIGETIHSHQLVNAPGGKGSNQAIMTSKLSKVSDKHIFIGCVGNDMHGREIIDNYIQAKVFVDVEKHCRVMQGPASGHASIWVKESTGENMIVLAMGANNAITKQHVKESLSSAKELGCSVFVVQLEVPLEIAVYGLKKAHKLGMTTIFNPAPARIDIPEDVWQYIDIVCPNETEAALITGKSNIESVVDAGVSAQWFIKKGVKSVIITLGSQGCVVIHQRSTIRHVKAFSLGSVVDTTGAGDSFIGSLAYFLSCSDVDFMDAVKYANYIASISVLKKGCQPSYPTRSFLQEQ